MRDLIAALVAVFLLLVAASLATTLRFYRRRRQRARDSERALGRTVVAEIPAEDDLLLFSEDDKRFYYGDRSIDKDLVSAARLLINGIPIAVSTSRRHSFNAQQTSAWERGGVAAEQGGGTDAIEKTADAVEGIARDRWDVAIEAVNGTTLVECGAIRERVSQELARAVFDAVKNYLERHHGRT